MAQIFIFGDSITYGASDLEGGWVTRLRKDLDQKMYSSDQYFEIFNLGVPGNTTADLLNRCEAELTARRDEEEKTFIVFAIGINDSKIIREGKSNKVNLEEFQNNLQALLDIAKRYSHQISFIGLTPVDETLTKGSYTNENIRKYDRAIQDFCLTQQLPFIEFLSVFESQDYKNLLEDGLHPNSDGHTIMVNLIQKNLMERLKI